MPVDVRELPVFARRLRQARERAGISQRELSRRMSLDPDKSGPRMSQYESGVHMPHLETIEALAKHLDVPVAFLFADSDRLAQMILTFSKLSVANQERLLRALKRKS